MGKKMENNNSKRENVEKATEGRTDDVKNKKILGGVETASGDSDVKKKSTYGEEHTVPLKQLEELLETDFKTGLTITEAKKRLDKFGPNCLTPPKKTPEWIKFLKTMFMGFAMLLWVGAFLCFLAYGIQSYEGDTSPDYLYIGGALTFVVIVSGLFTYYHTRRTSPVRSWSPSPR